MEACAQSGFALVPELDCCYLDLFGTNTTHWRVNHAWYTSGFGKNIADSLINRPVFNSGVWAASAASPIWQHWSKRLDESLSRADGKVNDQPALNVALYLDRVPFHPLTSVHNWVCSHTLPQWNGQALVRPAVPFEQLGIIHLTAACVNADVQIRNQTSDVFTTRLDFQSIQQLKHRRSESL